ncbi:MAG: membrane protein insertase YidC [Candidatus Krumholzibacteriia bacterium]
MERRLLLAFLLSTILIVGYQTLYNGPRMREAAQQKEAARVAEQRADSIAAAQARVPSKGEEVPERTPTAVEPPVEAAARDDDLTRADAGSATEISISTPLFRVTLSSAGGEIVSIRLFGYETAGEAVELIAARDDPAGGALALRLAGEERALRLGDVRFEPYFVGGTQVIPAGTDVRVDPSAGDKTILFRVEAKNGKRIERYYTFSPNAYLFRTGVRYAARDYPFVRQVEWGMGPGMAPTESNQQDDYAAFRANLRLGDEFHKKKRGNFTEEFSGVVQWAALKTKYFATILLPLEPTGGEAQVASNKEDFMSAAIRLPAVERRGRVDQAIDVYAGPLDYKALKAMDRGGLEKNVDIGFDHVKIFRPVSWAVLWSMLALHKFIPNYGIVILLISIFTKVVFYRLTHKSFKSMRDMQALQPKLQALKEKYKDDRQKLSAETMRLYKEGGVNPLGGCLPMLLQMPVFLALFNVLRNTIEIRRAPFFGWINDLSQQDVLFELPVSLPVIGSAVSVLPILMGVGMLLQSKIGGSIAGPSSTTTQPKAFTYMMPIVFTFLFYRMPSGLVLYWLVNTGLSVAQQYYINKGAAEDEKKKAVERSRKEQPPKPNRPKSKAKKG